MTGAEATPGRSIRVSAAYTVASNALQFGILFAGSVIIARLLTPDEMGVFAIAAAAQGLVFAFQNTGVIQYVIGQDSLPPRRIGAVLTIQALQSAAMAFVLVMLAQGVAWLLEEPRIIPAITPLALAALLAPAEMLPVGLLQREMRFDRLFVLGIGKAVASTAVAIAGAVHGLSYASLSWGALAGAVVAASIGLAFCGRRLRVRPNLEGWREYWRFGAAMLSIVVITNLCSRVSVILLGKLTDMASVGLFSRATGIVEMVQFGVMEPLGRLVLPSLAAQRRQHGEIGSTYLRAASVITAVNWAAFGGLAVLAEPLIELIYGPAWVPASAALVWLCLARMILELATCPIEVMVATDRLPALTRPVTIRAVLGLAAFAAGASFGLAWAASARALEAVLGVALVLPLLLAVTGVARAELLRVWGVGFAACLGATAPAFAYMQWQGWPATLPPATLAGLLLAGMLGWGLVLLACRNEIRSQMLLALARPAVGQAGPR
jgi:O-antigen/teichoic acid export membrane protein